MTSKHYISSRTRIRWYSIYINAYGSLIVDSLAKLSKKEDCGKVKLGKCFCNCHLKEQCKG